MSLCHLAVSLSCDYSVPELSNGTSGYVPCVSSWCIFGHGYLLLPGLIMPFFWPFLWSGCYKSWCCVTFKLPMRAFSPMAEHSFAFFCRDDDPNVSWQRCPRCEELHRAVKTDMAQQGARWCKECNCYHTVSVLTAGSTAARYTTNTL